MEAVSLLFHGCWVYNVFHTQGWLCSLEQQDADLLPSPLEQLLGGLRGWAQQCLHLLKDKHVGKWPLLWPQCCSFIALRKEKNCNEKARYQLHPWEEKNKRWLKLGHRTWASCGTSQTRLYILATPKLYPAWDLHLSLLRAAINVSGCVDRGLGRRVGCALALSSFSFKKGALFKIGLTLFSVACWKLAIMVSSGFATDYVNFQQINYLLAHEHTQHFVKWNYGRTLPDLVTPLCNPCGNFHKAQWWGDDMSVPTAASSWLSVGIADGVILF